MPKRRPATTSPLQRYCSLANGWPFWYSIIIIGVHSYLIYQAIWRYKVYSQSPTLHQMATLYLVTCVISSLLIPVLIPLLFLRLGTYTNDGLQVGISLLKKEITVSSHPTLIRLWRGAPPFAPMLHILSAYLLLIPSVFATARGLQIGAISDPKAGQFGRFIDGGYISVILSNSSASDDLNNEGLVIPSSTLELVNFVFGLLAYSAHMCSVFWQCSQQFALIFALQLLLAVALHVISYMGFTELYTLLFLDESSPASLALSPTLLTILYLLSSAILFASSWTVCQFGYGICLERIGGYLRRIGHTSPLSGLSGSCTAYMPHSIALVTIIVYVGCNGPIMYDSVSMYQQTGSRLLMTHLTACVVYMLVWITMWFTFTVKQDWEFSIQELALKRHAILLNRQQLFITPDNEFTEEPPSSNSSVANEPTTPTQSRVDVGEDNLSNSTTSTNNNDSHRAGILSQRLVKHKRRGNEQKVKFQEATKILIETDLDADLDTIAESDNEHADSALFSGSSNDSNESNHNLTHTVINEQPNISKAGHTPRYTINSTLAPTKSLILSPNHLNSQSAVTRLYKSTGDITNSTPRGDTPQQQSNYIYNGHPVSTTATRHDNTQRPYTIHHSIGRTNSNNKSTFIDNAISSAV